MASDDPDDDRCRVCGRLVPLSFEHVPPAAAGNEPNAWLYGIDAWLSRRKLDGPPVGRATILQRGAGVQTLCPPCNQRAGAMYVPELLAWTRRAEAGLANTIPPLREIDADPRTRHVTAKFEQVRPARFFEAGRDHAACA